VFAGIIVGSQPNFAIEFFGGWESGKTTLHSASRGTEPGPGIFLIMRPEEADRTREEAQV
jgi:hypothetical protein